MKYKSDVLNNTLVLHDWICGVTGWGNPLKFEAGGN